MLYLMTNCSEKKCWVSKQGKKGAWSSFLKKYLENILKKDVGFEKFEKAYRVIYIYSDRCRE